ncbi:hypothetical protein BC629DRAFT_166013 [Irpex lacteus]|nr:hypothetical protein BC629DRAFT_166013 [Irpex lacteus]
MNHQWRNHFLDQEDLRSEGEEGGAVYCCAEAWCAVIIPPGCVYQVTPFFFEIPRGLVIECWKAKTIGNIIQVTNGFIDQHTIGAVLELRDEWRKHRLPDTVQIKWVLWHAWHSLLALKDAREKAPPQANPDLTARASKRLKTRIYHCPHAGCKGNRRLFAVPSIFDHLYASLSHLHPSPSLSSSSSLTYIPFLFWNVGKHHTT